MFTGNLTLIMGYEFNSCGILQLKMQGWVGRVTLCIGDKFHAHPLYFVPALICHFHTYLNPWVRIRCERYAGICSPIFRFQCDETINDAMRNRNQFMISLEITLVRQREENRVCLGCRSFMFPTALFEVVGFV